jgi:hypothetical protein
MTGKVQKWRVPRRRRSPPTFVFYELVRMAGSDRLARAHETLQLKRACFCAHIRHTRGGPTLGTTERLSTRCGRIQRRRICRRTPAAYVTADQWESRFGTIGLVTASFVNFSGGQMDDRTTLSRCT